MRFPNRLLGRLRREKDDALPLMQNEPFDQHQPHEGLAEADSAVDEEGIVRARWRFGHRAGCGVRKLVGRADDEALKSVTGIQAGRGR